ncbi:MAG: Hsp20/alpha crystallin family protein [Oscillospiraceae bacterium]|nr:Hsp20/alpha crystallin family protein [Oscillospiraceae bacterium]
MSLIPYRRNNNTIASYYNPFRMMEQMERELFGDQRSGSFSTDIRETDTAYVLEADLPGFKKEDINIDISDNTLTIRAERHSEHEEKDKQGNYIRCERSYGNFSRSFGLDGVDTEAIKAGFDNGVLTLTMPKLTAPQPSSRRLEIE